MSGWWFWLGFCLGNGLIGSMNCPVAVLFLVLSTVSSVSAAPETEPKTTKVDGVVYRVVKASPDSIRIVWRGEDAKPLRTFSEALRYLTKRGESPLVLMNGGIFEPGGVPSGLLIQDRRELRPVNRKEGKGNFYLKPNGIFVIGSRGAAVIPTEEYPPKGVRIRCAVQSGPLLLSHGKIHPKFNSGSRSRLHRNGVGVTMNGEVVFAMTDFNSPKFPNLHEFARLFASFGCKDALFLDGDLSQMWTKGINKIPWNRFGAIIAVVENEKPEREAMK